MQMVPFSSIYQEEIHKIYPLHISPRFNGQRDIPRAGLKKKKGENNKKKLVEKRMVGCKVGMQQ